LVVAIPAWVVAVDAADVAVDSLDTTLASKALASVTNVGIRDPKNVSTSALNVALVLSSAGTAVITMMFV
jgi:hypothetical protein